MYHDLQLICQLTAIELLIEEREGSTWREEVLNWQGCPDFELSSNDDLIPPQESIF